MMEMLGYGSPWGLVLRWDLHPCVGEDPLGLLCPWDPLPAQVSSPG